VRDADDWASLDHSWFASFAPIKKPEIAVVVLVEHGGFGAKAATPVAMEIYKGYFEKVRPAHFASAPTANVTTANAMTVTP
jgi:penicillin-binding protein 2